MEITKNMVEHLANLSRLKFTDSELEEFKKEFEKTLEQVDKLKSIDTSKLEASHNSLDAELELRQDAPQKSLEQELALKEAPEKERGMFKIKKIVE